MSLVNATLELIEVLSSNGDNRYMTCISDIELWLSIHGVVVWLIQIYLILFYICFSILYVFLYILSPSSRIFIDYLMAKLPLLPFEYRGRYFYYIVWFVKEITLIFVYILLASFCKWFGLINNTSEITYMDFYRWFIEASLYVFFIFIYICIYLCHHLSDFIDDFQEDYNVLMVLKMPLFIIMRYAEYQPDCRVNTLKVSILKQLCERRYQSNT